MLDISTRKVLELGLLKNLQVESNKYRFKKGDVMEWKKAPEELAQFLSEKLKSVNCDYRKMFGYPAYFIKGNMFVGIHGENLFIKLSEADVEEIINANLNVTCFEPMPGRAMAGYVVLPKSIYSNEKLFDKWVNKSVNYVSSLPPKQKKKRG